MNKIELRKKIKVVLIENFRLSKKNPRRLITPVVFELMELFEKEAKRGKEPAYDRTP